jgi:hypothetical protein
VTPATYNRQPTTAILAELKARMTALKLADGTTPAFARVELFDSESLLEAFELLTLSEQRICVIVPLDETFNTENRGQILISTRILPVALLISDRVIGDRTKALFGSAANLGAYALAELALPVVTGRLLDNPNGVTVEPVNTSVLIIKNQKEKQNLPGRAAVALELQCRGGNLQAPLGPQPIL